MNGEWPEFVQALGIAIAAVLGAWQTRTAIKVKSLEAEVSKLKDEHRAVSEKLRVAIRHIRDWMAWERNHAPGAQPPPLPDELRDEV